MRGCDDDMGISSIELGRIRQANWRKAVCPAFPNPKKELAQFVRDYEAGDIPIDVPYATIF